MNSTTTTLSLLPVYLTAGLIFLFIIVKIIALPFKKAIDTTTQEQDAYGLYQLFSITISALFLYKIPELTDNALTIIKSGKNKNSWMEAAKLISIFTVLAFLFWLFIHYAIIGILKISKKGSSLILEISANNKATVYAYAGIGLILSSLMQHSFITFCQIFIPSPSIPFYR